MPVSIISYFCRGYLARIIFKAGSRDIALIFGFLTVAIFFRIMYTLFSRYFYAHKDTVTPLLVSLFAIALNIVLAFTLARPSAYGASGLAMAQSIVAACEVAILLSIMIIRDHKLFDKAFLANVGRSISVSGFTIIAAFIMVTLLPLGSNDKGFITLGFKTSAIAVVTLLVHLSISSLFGLQQAKTVTAKLASIVLKPIKIQ